MIVIIIVAILIIVALNHVAHERGTEQAAVLDTGHTHLPIIDAGPTGDVLVAATVVPLLSNPSTLPIAINVFLIVMLIRGAANTLTILPSTDRHRCNRQHRFSLLGPTCHGLHVSGHFAFASAFLLVAIATGRLPWWAATLWAAVIAFIIVAERRHYSSDIFFAGVLAALVYASKLSIL
jgi:membrane-associated phospholipid phosphatase